MIWERLLKSLQTVAVDFCSAGFLVDVRSANFCGSGILVRDDYLFELEPDSEYSFLVCRMHKKGVVCDLIRRQDFAFLETSPTPIPERLITDAWALSDDLASRLGPCDWKNCA